jgi:hypothetical protein
MTNDVPMGLINPFDLFLRNEKVADNIFDGHTFLGYNGSSGIWSRNREPIDPDERYLSNMRGVALGWVKLADNKVVDRRTGLLITGYQRPDRDQLDDADQRSWPRNRRGEAEDPWRKVIYLPLRAMQSGENLVFSPFATTQRDAITSFIGLYHRSARGGMDPVVQLESRSFINQSGGTTFVPMFRIVDWGHWDDAPAPEVQPVPIPPEQPAEKPAARLAAPRHDESEEDIPF